MDDRVRCACGCEMYKFPEAYLCPKCDAQEIQKLSIYYSKRCQEPTKEVDKK